MAAARSSWNMLFVVCIADSLIYYCDCAIAIAGIPKEQLQEFCVSEIAVEHAIFLPHIVVGFMENIQTL